MKIIIPIVLAGAALAFCGCTTDSPIISTPASQANQASNGEAVRGSDNSNNGAGPSAGEETRDIANQRNSSGTMTGGGGNNNDPTQSGAQQMQSMNPYGH